MLVKCEQFEDNNIEEHALEFKSVAIRKPLLNETGTWKFITTLQTLLGIQTLTDLLRFMCSELRFNAILEK